jgi:hypothetical protein
MRILGFERSGLHAGREIGRAAMSGGATPGNRQNSPATRRDTHAKR